MLALRAGAALGHDAVRAVLTHPDLGQAADDDGDMVAMLAFAHEPFARVELLAAGYGLKGLPPEWLLPVCKVAESTQPGKLDYGK